jgi:hypothetical protein
MLQDAWGCLSWTDIILLPSWRWMPLAAAALTHEGICSAFGIDADAFAIGPALVLSEELRDILNDSHLHWGSMHPAPAVLSPAPL